MRTRLIALVLALAVAPGLARAEQIAQAGVAGGVHGLVQIEKAEYTPPGRAIGAQLGSGAAIYMGDLIGTGPDSGLQIMLLDETTMTIGPDAKMTIDKLVYDPASPKGGSMAATITQGAFRYVSGKIAEANEGAIEIHAGPATIGVRGTIMGGYVQGGAVVAALLGPAFGNNANARAGQIAVTSAGVTRVISRPGFAVFIPGPGQPPSLPQRLTLQQAAQLGSPTRAATQPGTQGGTTTTAATTTGGTTTTSGTTPAGGSAQTDVDTALSGGTSSGGLSVFSASGEQQAEFVAAPASVFIPNTTQLLETVQSNPTTASVSTNQTVNSQSSSASSTAATLNSATDGLTLFLLPNSIVGETEGFLLNSTLNISNGSATVSGSNEDGEDQESDTVVTGTSTATLLFADSDIELAEFGPGTLTVSQTNDFDCTTPCSETVTVGVNEAILGVFGNGPSTLLPFTGIATYDLKTATPVYWTNGKLAPGTLSGPTSGHMLTINMNNFSVTYDFTVTMPGDTTYTIFSQNSNNNILKVIALPGGGYGIGFSDNDPGITISGSTSLACGGPASDCVGKVSGFLAGNTLQDAGIAFLIGTETSSSSSSSSSGTVSVGSGGGGTFNPAITGAAVLTQTSLTSASASPSFVELGKMDLTLPAGDTGDPSVAAFDAGQMTVNTTSSGSTGTLVLQNPLLADPSETVTLTSSATPVVDYADNFVELIQWGQGTYLSSELESFLGCTTANPCNSTITIPANEAITGALGKPPLTPLPMTGTVFWDETAATPVFSTNGSQAPGTVVNASLEVNFASNFQTTYFIQISMPGDTGYEILNTVNGAIVYDQQLNAYVFAFNDKNPVVVTGAYVNGTFVQAPGQACGNTETCSGQVTGFLAGNNLERALLSYVIGVANTSGTLTTFSPGIQGSIALEQDGALTASGVNCTVPCTSSFTDAKPGTVLFALPNNSGGTNSTIGESNASSQSTSNLSNFTFTGSTSSGSASLSVTVPNPAGTSAETDVYTNSTATAILDYSDAIVSMYSMLSGTMTCTGATCGGPYTIGSNQLATFIVGTQTTASQLPTTGTATYSQIAATPLTATNNSGLTGTLTNANINVNFGTLAMSIGFTVNINGDGSYNFLSSTSETTFTSSSTGNSFTGFPALQSMNATGTLCTSSGSTACQAVATGALYGSSAQRAAFVVAVGSHSSSGTQSFSNFTGVQGGVILSK